MPLCGLAGWAVAVQGVTVGAGGGGGAVAVEPHGPAPTVDHDLVVEGAQGKQVVQRGRAAAGSGDDVVDLAHAGRLGATGEGAVRVPGSDRAAQVRWDGLG